MKKIISSIIILFLSSAILLSWHETRLASPQNQNWWSLYFVNAKDNSLDFTIENNSNQTNFHWTLSDDNNKITEGDVQINKGEKKEINFPKAQPSENGKKAVDVTAGSDKKEIYKNF